MKWEQRFKGEYLSTIELGDRQPTFTITKISTTRLDDEKKKREVDKAVMFFKEVDRGWMYSKTAGHCLAKMFGEDDAGWIGKRITLYADEDVYFGSDQVGGIRIAGSPDIQKPLIVRIKFQKKRAFEVKLVQTAAPRPQQQQHPNAPSDQNVPIT